MHAPLAECLRATDFILKCNSLGWMDGWMDVAGNTNVKKVGGRAGEMVRALASQQCGLGSIPRLGVICRLSLLVLNSAPRDFFRVHFLDRKPTFDCVYWLISV